MLAYVGLNLVAMATPFAPLKILIAHLNSRPRKSYYSREKCLDFLYGYEIGAILAYFGLNLVAVVIPFAPLKILIAYLYSTTPKTLPYMQKVCPYLAVAIFTSENKCVRKWR